MTNDKKRTSIAGKRQVPSTAIRLVTQAIHNRSTLQYQSSRNAAWYCQNLQQYSTRWRGNVDCDLHQRRQLRLEHSSDSAGPKADDWISFVGGPVERFHTMVMQPNRSISKSILMIPSTQEKSNRFSSKGKTVVKSSAMPN